LFKNRDRCSALDFWNLLFEDLDEQKVGRKLDEQNVLQPQKMTQQSFPIL